VHAHASTSEVVRPHQHARVIGDPVGPPMEATGRLHVSGNLLTSRRPPLTRAPYARVQGGCLDPPAPGLLNTHSSAALSGP
jgi:hypothetical protein